MEWLNIISPQILEMVLIVIVFVLLSCQVFFLINVVLMKKKLKEIKAKVCNNELGISEILKSLEVIMSKINIPEININEIKVVTDKIGLIKDEGNNSKILEDRIFNKVYTKLKTNKFLKTMGIIFIILIILIIIGSFGNV